MRILAVLSISIAFATTGSAQQIYKWVDETGKVHFSDKPVNASSKTVTIKQQPRIGLSTNSTGSDTNKNMTQQKLLDAYADKRRQKQLDAQKQQAKDSRLAAHNQQCENARNYLATTKGIGIFETNEKGERIYLSDELIASERTKLQDDIKKYCK